jgi:hypothetical protein
MANGQAVPKIGSEFGAQWTIRIPLISCTQVQTALFQMRIVWLGVEHWMTEDLWPTDVWLTESISLPCTAVTRSKNSTSLRISGLA